MTSISSPMDGLTVPQKRRVANIQRNRKRSHWYSDSSGDYCYYGSPQNNHKQFFFHGETFLGVWSAFPPPIDPSRLWQKDKRHKYQENWRTRWLGAQKFKWGCVIYRIGYYMLEMSRQRSIHDLSKRVQKSQVFNSFFQEDQQGFNQSTPLWKASISSHFAIGLPKQWQQMLLFTSVQL